MNRISLAAALALASCATLAQAGWHHRHAYQAAPVYAYPAFAPAQVFQGAPQAGLGDVLLSRLLERVFDRVTTGIDTGTTSTDMTKVEKDLQELKASLTALDGRVENINTAVANQGRGLSKLDADLATLREQVKVNADAHQIALSAVLSKLDDRTSAEVMEMLDKDTEFRTALTTHLKDAGQLPGAIDKIKALLKKAKPATP